MVGQATERIILALARKDICTNFVGSPSLEIFDDRQANGANGFSLLTVLQSQTACLGVDLCPFQADHLAAPAAGQRNLANDVRGHGVFVALGGVAEHLTQYSILRLGKPTLSYIVLWLANAMGRVALDDTGVDGVGKDVAEKTNRARGRSRTASDDRLSAQLLGLDRNLRLSGHDVLEDLVDVGLGEVLDPPGPYEWNNVALNAANVSGDRRRLLRSPAFPQDEPGLQIFEIAGTQLLHGDRLVIELTLFGGIISPSDSTELDFRLLARGLGRPGSVEPNCVAT